MQTGQTGRRMGNFFLPEKILIRDPELIDQSYIYLFHSNDKNANRFKPKDLTYCLHLYPRPSFLDLHSSKEH